jgi:hypothetical protein
MTQKIHFLLWGYLFIPLNISAQVTYEATYETTDLHRVNWTFGGEKYWYVNDSLKQIKIYSAQHQLEKTIPYPSVTNAQVRLLQGEYGMTQTVINSDALLEMVWLIKDTLTKQNRLLIQNEQNDTLFTYNNPFESVSFSEIEGLATKMFIAEYEAGIEDYITKVYSLPSFSLENIYFRAYKLHRKKFGYAGEIYLYKDVKNEKFQFYNSKHRFWKSIKSKISGVYFEYGDDDYTDADDSYFVNDSLIEVSFSYFDDTNDVSDYWQAILNENSTVLLKVNLEFRVDKQKNLHDKLFAETWRNTTDNYYRVYNLPNSNPFKVESTLRTPFARAFLKKYGETIFYRANSGLELLSNKIAIPKLIQLPTLQNYGIYCGQCYTGIRDFYNYFNISDVLIQKDTLIEVIYLLKNSGNNFMLRVTNDTGKIYETIDSTKYFSINETKDLLPKLFTKTGNDNPYNTKVWRLGGEPTPVYETPSVLELKTYPNPSQNEIMIEITGNTEGDKYELSVFNMLGQNVFSINKSDKTQWILKKEQVGKGVFLIKISDGKNSVSKKILFE